MNLKIAQNKMDDTPPQKTLCVALRDDWSSMDDGVVVCIYPEGKTINDAWAVVEFYQDNEGNITMRRCVEIEGGNGIAVDDDGRIIER